MTTATRQSQIRNPRALFIGGHWVEPAGTTTFDVLDSATEEVFVTVAEAQAPDIDRAVAAARAAFDTGPWPRMSPMERGAWLNKIADAWETRGDALADSWASESGVLRAMSVHSAKGVAQTFRYYAGLAETFACERARSGYRNRAAIRGPHRKVGGASINRVRIKILAGRANG